MTRSEVRALKGPSTLLPPPIQKEKRKKEKEISGSTAERDY
jgi:hypothetical protein